MSDRRLELAIDSQLLQYHMNQNINTELTGKKKKGNPYQFR